MNAPIRRGEAGPSASTFCLGTAEWGATTRGDDLDRLYDAFRGAGGNFFDSAHVYAFWLPAGAGASERALGEIVRRRNDRDHVILATKGGHPDMGRGYPRPDEYLSSAVIARDVAESLDRLGVDSIDLYFLHRDDPRIPVGEIVDMLDEHVALGHLHGPGASNWTTARIAAANDYAAARGRRGFVARQPQFSLALPNPSKDSTVPPFGPDDLEWHARTALPVCAYSPTANGYFATNGLKGTAAWHNPTSAARLSQTNRLAADLGATPNQVALAWLLHQAFPVTPILGTANVEHLTDALGAAAIRLSADQVTSLAATE